MNMETNQNPPPINLEYSSYASDHARLKAISILTIWYVLDLFLVPVGIFFLWLVVHCFQTLYFYPTLEYYLYLVLLFICLQWGLVFTTWFWCCRWCRNLLFWGDIRGASWGIILCIIILSLLAETLSFVVVVTLTGPNHFDPGAIVIVAITLTGILLVEYTRRILKRVLVK